MGYFEGLGSGSFKIARDGRGLFFPWGIWGRGYVLASEDDQRRVRTQVKTYMMVNLLLTVLIVLIFPQRYGILAAWALVSMGVYRIWMWYALRGLERTDERLRWQESLTTQANAYGESVLWLMTIGSLVFVLGGLLMLLGSPDQRLLALAGTVFFGFCASVAIRMLVLRYRAEKAAA